MPQVRSFMTFLGLNLTAAYAPALCWVPGLPDSASAWVWPLAPVMLVLLELWSSSTAVAAVVLGVFLVAVLALSACLHRVALARVFVPGLLFVYSLLQGLLVLRIVAGIDALGHS